MVSYNHSKGNNDKGHRPGGKVMYHTYKVTFQSNEGKRKSLKIEASGIIPAIQLAVQETYFKNFCIAWNIVKVEDVTK